MMKSLQQSRALVGLAFAASGLTASCNSNQPRWSTNPTFNTPVGSLQLTLAQSALSLTSGKGTINATVTPAGGFTGLIQFNPVGGEQLGLSISPGSIDIEGTAAVTVALTLTQATASTGSEAITIAASATNQSAEAQLTVTAN